jgi:hypothetical protein
MVQLVEEKELGLLKKYPMQFFMVLLVGAITWQSFKLDRTENKVEKLYETQRDYLYNDHSNLIKVVDNNTAEIKNANELLSDVRTLLIGNQKNK